MSQRSSFHRHLFVSHALLSPTFIHESTQGALQVGALQALLGKGIKPDLIVGSSAGALNGAFLASDPTLTGARQLAKLWQRMRQKHVYPGNCLSPLWRLICRASLYPNANIQRFLRSSPRSWPGPFCGYPFALRFDQLGAPMEWRLSLSHRRVICRLPRVVSELLVLRLPKIITRVATFIDVRKQTWPKYHQGIAVSN